MKRCPECRRDYYDDSLMYCLDDGTALLEGPASLDEPETAVLSADRPSEAATRTLENKPTFSPRDAPVATNRQSIIAGVIGVVLVTALGIGSYLYYGRGQSRQISSIAVMPFTNESGNPDMEYLSDGMTETLISTLTQLPDLNVKARSSVFRYKGKETDPAALGRELNVQAILNGRVVQRGDELTLYLELVDAVTGNQIWGEQYDRKQSDLVSLQRELARDVASKLQAKLSSADQQKLAKNYTSNPEAYQLYLKGISYWNKRGPKNIEIAIGYYQQAIAVDPDYSLAYTGLADAYAQPSQQPGGMPKARAAALKALSLDNTLAEAHSALGNILVRFDLDFAGAGNEFRRALELNPTYAGARCRYAALLSNLGKFEASESEYQHALELEPQSLVSNVGYGGMLFYARRNDDAVGQLRKTIELDDSFFLAHAVLAVVFQVTGKWADSVQ